MSRATRERPAVYTIPPGMPFLDALAAGIRDSVGDAPEDLARVTVLLPTRRACRALGEAFLRHSGGRALLLPGLEPLGDVDEDDLAFAALGDEAPGGNGAAFEIAPAVSGLRRQLLLTRLVLAKEGGRATPDQAARLALELGRFIDQARTERLSFDALADLAPEGLAEHWRITLDFLKILTEQWPAVLEAEGCVDAATRRNRLLEARAEAWRRHPPADPVIAAGSTGTIPATADLLGVVARLPQGAVVLPGLDREADEETHQAFGPTHPQYAMARLIETLGVARGEVEDWPTPLAPPSSADRASLVNRALRPAATAAAARARETPAAALDGVTRIECPGPREEAGVIALLMRDVLETPGRTAALITPDRGLARRVAAELARWGVTVDDSAGRPLARTAPGAFLRLSVRMVADRMAPVPLLALLKHPLAAGGQAPAAFRARVRELETAALEGPRPGDGAAGLLAALGPSAAPALESLIETLETACAPLARLLTSKDVPFAEVLRAHVDMAEALAASDSDPGAGRLWAGEAGEAAATFIADLAEAAAVLGPIAGSGYPALLEALMAGRVVRPRFGRHPRLHIWGLLEARLQHADRLILGGLNEGTWPPEAHASPWMSRPMLARFGLPPPERRIGLSAHDFCQAMAAPEVMLTHATRVDGTPTVPSRWLLRLENLLRATELEAAFRPDARWLGWFAGLDAPAALDPAPQPRPRPPVSVRPRRLSVSRIETWVRDPYAIYARHILNLEPRTPIDADPGAADRGIIIHHALERFLEEQPDVLADDAVRRLLGIGEEVFREFGNRPGVRAFWWPRFERIARWFVEDFERERRGAGYETLGTEVTGRIDIAGPAGAFTLTARADRIDRVPGGGLDILDYKTGAVPSAKQVKVGFSPQLSLEAAIAEAGGFEGIPAAAPAALTYVQLTGRRPAGKGRALKLDAAEEARKAREGLGRRIALFDDADTPYLSRVAPLYERYAGDYDHLARVKEWRAAAEDGE